MAVSLGEYYVISLLTDDIISRHYVNMSRLSMKIAHELTVNQSQSNVGIKTIMPTSNHLIRVLFFC